MLDRLVLARYVVLCSSSEKVYRNTWWSLCKWESLHHTMGIYFDTCDLLKKKDTTPFFSSNQKERTWRRLLGPWLVLCSSPDTWVGKRWFHRHSTCRRRPHNASPTHCPAPIPCLSQRSIDGMNKLVVVSSSRQFYQRLPIAWSWLFAYVTVCQYDVTVFFVHGCRWETRIAGTIGVQSL